MRMIADLVPPRQKLLARSYDTIRTMMGNYEGHSTALLWLAAVLVAIIAFALRSIHLGRSFDIFYDEIIYHHIASNVADRLHISYYEYPFFLHPPMFFLLEGAYLKILGIHGDIVQQIYAARYLNAALAGCSAAFLFLLIRRTAGWPAGFAVAGIFALEPFLVRINSRLLLETSAMFWILAGYCILLCAKDYRMLALWRVVGAGGAFGAAILTKETTIFVTLIPLGICFIFGWSISRRAAAAVAAIALTLYSCYPIAIALVGDREQFRYQKLRGLLRFVGVVQETGFNQPNANGPSHGPSFTEAILRNLGQFGTTYTFIGLGAVGVCVLFILGDRASRLLTSWVASAYALQIFFVLIGTNEEQYFYYLVVPAVTSTVAAAALLVHQAGKRRGMRRFLVASYAACMVLFFTLTSYLWVVRHFTPDNGYEQLMGYVQRNVQEGTTIASTNNTFRELIKAYRYELGLPYEAARASSDVVIPSERNYQYVTLSTLSFKTGYDAQGAALYDWLERNARRDFVFEGPSNGLLYLYYIPTNVPLSGAAPDAPPRNEEPIGPSPMPTAGSVATTVTTAPETATPPAPATPTPVPPSVAEVRRRVAAAEGTLRSGRIIAMITYPNGRKVTVTAEFDFGDGKTQRRLRLNSVYQGVTGQRVSETILIGDRVWAREGDGSWKASTSSDGFWEQLQYYLSHSAEAEGVRQTQAGVPTEFRWYDADSGTDVVLLVDPATGIPQRLWRKARADGTEVVVDYHPGWNVPVTILPPPGP